jgi:NADPH2:quinone reductase
MSYVIEINRYGGPEVLTRREIEPAPPQPNEVCIRTLFAAINHTDLHIRSGDWPVSKQSPFPYVPGVEVVGMIDSVGSKVTGWAPGQIVITMMQGLGGVRAERPGGYAEFVIVAATALAKIPEGVEPAHMAALGLGAVTAFEGLRRIGDLSGKRIIITGSAGGVGSSAVSIAHAQGASVAGIIRREADAEYVLALGASEVIVSGREAIGQQSADGVLDTVGGDLFPLCVSALKSNGALCLVGAVAGSDVSFNAWELIRPVRLTGYSTETLDGGALREAVHALARLLIAGAIRVPDYQIVPLVDASEAHRMLEKREVRGRVLLQP